VRLILFPLSKKQQLSMQKMQKLAPKLKAIREKFKGNRQKQNEETVKLYKQYGVNPAAGCLPLVIQLPVFFGLFGALSYAIELRKQPFLYITDLSVADGLSMQFLKTDITVPLIGFNIQYLNILPIVMIIVWVLQQALAPRAVDPQQRSQQKMMMVMPVIFGLLLYNYAAGLSIYMICNMFLGMVEQAIVKRIVARHIADEEPQPVSQPKGAKQTGRRR
jgi:YidC/Oxa1 family membrane protein insertase